MADFVTDRGIPANGNCQPDTWASTIAAISEQLTEPLTKLAHVPASAKKKFDCEGIIEDWISTVIRDSWSREEFEILTRLINTATELRNQLQMLEDQTAKRMRSLRQTGLDPNPPPRRGPIRFEYKREDAVYMVGTSLDMWIRMGPDFKRPDRHTSIQDLSADLSYFVKAARYLKEYMFGPIEKGRRAGIKGYGGLNRLVFLLECEARAVGGRFSINKRDCKGTMLDALDLLRTSLLTHPNTKWLSTWLPPPDKHAVATYYRLMVRARKLQRSARRGSKKPG